LTYADRAEALDRLGRHADAQKDWDRAIDLTGGTAPSYRCFRLLSEGRTPEAVAAADELAAEKDVQGNVLYALARVDALAAAHSADAGKGERYAARAVALLRQASERGYDPAARMKTDPALASLRKLKDFQKLLADLEAEAKKP
jgi:hypothetical protein